MVANPLFKNGLVDGVFHMAKDQMLGLVEEYVAKMETERTNEWCKCEWIIHPEDVELDTENCAECHHPNLVHMSGFDPYCTKQDHQMCDCAGWVDPPKRRMRRGTLHDQCPVHTKEGFILGFFEWVFPNGS